MLQKHLKSSFVKRIMLGLSANAFGQVVNIATQLASVPLFLYYWTPSVYGVWLVLSAIPIYFLMLDGGIVAAAMNEITMSSAKADHDRSNNIFQSALSATLAIVILALGMSTLVIILLDVGIMKNDMNKITLILLIATSLIHLFSGLFDAIFRSINQYAKWVFIAQIANILVFVGSIIGLVAGNSYITVALGLFAGKSLVFMLIYLYLKNKYPQFVWAFSLQRMKEFRPLLSTGLSWMSFRVSDAITLQGSTLLVGSILGGPAVALYNTYRTVSRSVFQLLGMLGNTLWPEFARLQGKRDFNKIKIIMNKANVTVTFISVLLCLMVYIAGPMLLKVWTHGKIPFVSSSMLLMLLYAVAISLWFIPKIYLTASNQIGWLSVINILTAAGSTLLAFPLAKLWGIVGVVGALLVGEILIGVVAHFVSQNKIHVEI